MSTAKLREKTIELPDEVLEELGLKEGDELDVGVEDDTIVLRHREVDEAERDPATDAAIDEGLKALEEGDVTPAFDSIDELVAYLKTKDA